MQDGYASTANREAGVQSLKEGQRIIDRLIVLVNRDSSQSEPADLNEVEQTNTDAEIMEIARRAANATKFGRLYDDGDTTMHNGDASAADQALINICLLYTSDAADE